MLKRQAASLCTGVIVSALLLICFEATVASGWSNGGYSGDPTHPSYGTHDWIAEHALDWLPAQEKQFFTENLAWYLYGTELPDNGTEPGGVGDTTKHHVYFYANGTVQNDASAVRAGEEYENAKQAFAAGNLSAAAMHLGMVTHYIDDMAVFGHVMGSKTAWGTETHHTSDYEPYVLSRTDNYADEFNVFLAFDGNLSETSAYDAALTLAHDTTFDVDGDLTCVWMDQHYDWSDATFKNRCGESLNLAVNLIADVLHLFYTEAIIPENTFFTSCFLIWFCLLGLILFLRLFRRSSLSPKRERALQSA